MINRKALENLDAAIDLICNEMKGRNADKVEALAGILRDLAIARAVLSDEKNYIVKTLSNL